MFEGNPRRKDELIKIGTYEIISSVILCELSMRPRSANNESAAEDLYALVGR